MERTHMRSLRTVPAVMGLATLVGVAAVSTMLPTSSAAAPSRLAASTEAPAAVASGVDVVTPLYPSLVNVRLDRVEAALGRATTAVDQGQEAVAITEMVSA